MTSDEHRRTDHLVRHIQAGAHHEFAALYERVAPALFAWACHRIDPILRTRLDPEDILQEVWSRALMRFDSLEGRGVEFRPWIFRIAKNVLLEGSRRAQRMVNLVDASGERSTRVFGLSQVSADVTSITERLSRQEGVQDFLKYLSGLDSEDKLLVMFCGLEEQPAAKVARRMGLSVEAVYKRWQRLRDRIRHECPSFELIEAS